jgi:hypothetical protein
MNRPHGQFVLALPVAIDRAFRHPGLGGDQLGGGRVDARSTKTSRAARSILGLAFMSRG